MRARTRATLGSGEASSRSRPPRRTCSRDCSSVQRCIRIQAFVNGFEEDTGITEDQWVPPGVSYDQPIRTICKAYCAQYGHGECAPPSAPPPPLPPPSPPAAPPLPPYAPFCPPPEAAGAGAIDAADAAGGSVGAAGAAAAVAEARDPAAAGAAGRAAVVAAAPAAAVAAAAAAQADDADVPLLDETFLYHASLTSTPVSLVPYIDGCLDADAGDARAGRADEPAGDAAEDGHRRRHLDEERHPLPPRLRPARRPARLAGRRGAAVVDHAAGRAGDDPAAVDRPRHLAPQGELGARAPRVGVAVGAGRAPGAVHDGARDRD